MEWGWLYEPLGCGRAQHGAAHTARAHAPLCGSVAWPKDPPTPWQCPATALSPPQGTVQRLWAARHSLWGEIPGHWPPSHGLGARARPRTEAKNEVIEAATFSHTGGGGRPRPRLPVQSLRELELRPEAARLPADRRGAARLVNYSIGPENNSTDRCRCKTLAIYANMKCQYEEPHMLKPLVANETTYACQLKKRRAPGQADTLYIYI